MKILLKKYITTFCFSLTLIFAPVMAFAEATSSRNLDEEVSHIKEVIQKGIINNLVTIAALAGFVICAVSAAGGNIGQIAIQNMGYVVFLIFGSTLILKFIDFAQSM